MPLSAGYGVVIGTIADYYRDPPDNYGKYYHGNVIVNTPAGNYHCAIGSHWDVVVDVALISMTA